MSLVNFIKLKMLLSLVRFALNYILSHPFQELGMSFHLPDLIFCPSIGFSFLVKFILKYFIILNISYNLPLNR